MVSVLIGKYLIGGVGVREGFLEEIMYKLRVRRAKGVKRKQVFLEKRQHVQRLEHMILSRNLLKGNWSHGV